MEAPQTIESDARSGRPIAKFISDEHGKVYYLRDVDGYYNSAWKLMSPKEVRAVLYYIPQAVAWADSHEVKKPDIVEKSTQQPRKKRKAKKE